MQQNVSHSLSKSGKRSHYFLLHISKFMTWPGDIFRYFLTLHVKGVFSSLILTPALLVLPWGCYRLAPERVNHWRDSFALNIMKPFRWNGTFSSYPLMLVMLRSPLQHQDKGLMPEGKASLMPLPLLFFFRNNLWVVIFVCVCRCACVFVLRICIRTDCMFCL